MSKGQMKKQSLKRINIAIAIILLLVVGITIFVNADDSQVYVVNVMDAKSKDDDAVDDGDIQIHKQIMKDNTTEPFYDSKAQTYKVNVKDINTELTPEIAMIVDSSYSVGQNDSENTLKANAISLAQAVSSDCKNAKIKVFNGAGPKSDKLQVFNNSANLTTITNAINNLTSGEGTDISNGIEAAKTSFTAGDNIDKYIVVFTDSTDDTREILSQVDEIGIKIVIVSVEDIMSNSYIQNGVAVYGRVQMIYSPDRIEEKLYDEFNPQTITNFINVALTDITITDNFSDGIIDNFDLEILSTGLEVETTETGYVWTIDKLNRGEELELTFKLTLKDQEIEDSAYTYHNIFSSESIVAEYKTNRYESSTIDNQIFTVNKEKTPYIQIRDKYSVTIKAVSEEESAIVLAGVKFNIVGTALENFDNVEPGTVIYNQELTTDKYGMVTIDDIRTTGDIKFEITPTVDQIGYTNTDMAEITVTTNKFGKNLAVVSQDWKDPNKSIVDSNNRNITINFPISTEKFVFNVNLTQAGNKNVVLSDSEFRLIAPKRDNANEFIARYGKTDANGKLSFAPSIMTTAGTYDYILSQHSAQDGYYAIDNVTVRITFDNQGHIVENGVQIAGNPAVSGIRDSANSCTVTVTNESDHEDCFGLELNLVDEDNNNKKLEGAEYDVVVTRTTNGERISTTYPKNITNEKGKINIELPGSGLVQVKITQTKATVGYDLDSETKIIILRRVDGTVESVSSAYNETSLTSVDARAYSAENKVIVNLTNKMQPERNMLNLKLVDLEEEDIPISNVTFKLTNNMNGTYINATTDSQGMASVQLPKENAGIYNYTIENVSGLPIYYNAIPNSNISIQYNSDGMIDDVSDAYTGTADNPILEIDGVELVSEDGYADHTATVTLGAATVAGNSYIFQVKLVDADSNVSLEGGTYDIKITSGDLVREIKGRKTNASGIIETKLILDEDITIEVTETESPKKYKIDDSTKEIVLHYNRTTNVLTKENDTDSAVVISGNRVVYTHTNHVKTTDDIFLDFTVSKIYEDESSAAQLPLWIHQDISNPGDATVTFTDDSIMQNGEKIVNNTYNDAETNTYLDVFATTDSNGTVMLENLKVSGVPNQGEAFANIIVDEVTISYDENNNIVTTIKADSRVKYHVTYRYNQYTETMELTNVEITQGVRNVKEGSKSFQGVDTSRGYQSYVTSTLYADLGLTGNLVIDVLEQDIEGNTLEGATYDITIQQPNNIGNKVYRAVPIKDNKVELPSVITNIHTTITFKPVEAPIGYALSEDTYTLIVTDIDATGEVYLSLESGTDSKLSAELPEDRKIFTSSGDDSGVTEYTLIFTNNETDTFRIKFNVFDNDTQQPIKGYSFKVELSSKQKVGLTDATDVYGETSALVGPNYKNDEGDLVYTISTDGAADYYKKFADTDMIIRFSANRKVVEAVKSIQTDAGYGELENGGKWYIREIDNKDYDVLVEIYVEKQDPVDVEVETLDRVTLQSVPNATYDITPNLGTSSSRTDEITKNAWLHIYYPSANRTVTYTLTNISMVNYDKIDPQQLVISYDENGDIDPDETKTYVISDDLEIAEIQGRYIKLKTKANPRIKVNITTKDFITGAVLSEGEEAYTITDQAGVITSGNIEQDKTQVEIDNGFVRPNQNNLKYIIQQDSIPNNYELQTEKNIYVDYDEDGNIVAARRDDGENHITIDSFEQNILNITVYNEPRQGIHLENYDYYTNELIGGGIFTFESELDSSRRATLIVAGDGNGTTLGSRLGEANQTVKYTVKQTGADQEYAKVKDFEIEVTYNSNREIQNVRLLDSAMAKWITVSYKVPSEATDKGYNGNDKGIVKLVVKSEYSFRIKITNLDRFDNSVKVPGTVYSVTSTIPTEGRATTDTEGKGTAYLDRTEPSTRVVYTIKEEKPGDDYQNLESGTVDVEVTFDEDGYVTLGNTKIANGQGVEYAVVSDVDPRVTIKDKFTINLTITNIPKFRVNITNLDREDNSIPIAETKYSITSEIGNNFDDITTDNNGKANSRIIGSTIGKEVIYTIHEDRSASEYQDLEEDIKIKAIFNTDGKLTSTEVVQGNRYGTVAMIQNPQNTFEQMTAEVVITNNPIFNINIVNIDRSTNGPLADTEYEVTRDSDDSVEINKTDSNGMTDFKAKSTHKDQECVYTIHEITPSAAHQAQEQDIKVKVKFDADGHIAEYSVIQGNAFASITKEENPTTTQENFRLHLTIINNKYVDIEIHNYTPYYEYDAGTGIETRKDYDVEGTKYTLEATIVDTSEVIETKGEQATNSQGRTNFSMEKGLANKTIKYTITETYNIPTKEKLNSPVELTITYDNEGKIVENMTSISGLDNDPYKIWHPAGEYYALMDRCTIIINVSDFKVEVSILSDDKPNFYVSLTANDIYDSNKDIAGVKADAYLLVPGTTQPDSAYTMHNITTKEQNGYIYGIGVCDQYTQLDQLHRQLQINIKDVPVGYSNFTNGTDKTKDDFLILLDVEFTPDEGRVKKVSVNTDRYDESKHRWYPTSDMIQVYESGYGISVHLNLYPILQLKLHSQDQYTQEELGAGLTLSTSTFPVRDLGVGDVVQQGWIGKRYVSQWDRGNYPYGTVYSNNESNLDAYGKPFADRFARTETVNNGVRYFYLYENNEPNGYNRYRPEDPNKYYNERRIATIKVQYDTCGKILSAEVTEWRSSNSNRQDYIDLVADNENNTLEVKVKYLRTTTMTINVKDGVSEANISSVKVYPFNSGNRRYNGDKIKPEETTNGDGFATWRYWDVNFAEATRTFELGTGYYGTGFGGYFGIGNIHTTVSYDENGLIKSATAKADNADIEASWEGTNLHLDVKIKRKFIMLIDSKDIYDTTVSLPGQFNVSSNEYIDEVASNVSTRTRFVVGAIHPGETVTYQIKEETTINGYIPMDVMKLTVVFREDGTIASATVNDEAKPYFDVLSTADLESGMRDEDTTDLQIRVKKIPSFVTRVNLTDEFYPSIKLQGGEFTLENSKGDVQNGSLVTDAEGTAVTFVGPIYPNENISYTLKQVNSITDYFSNLADMTFDVEFTGNGYIKTYNVTSIGNDNKLTIENPTYVNKRYVNLDVANKPKYINVGLSNIDDLSGEGINDVQFEITAKEGDDTNTITFNTQTYGGVAGLTAGKLDDVIETSTGRVVEYTVKQLNVPKTYRKIQDFTFKVYYNNDGSISYDDHTLPDNVEVKVYRKGTGPVYVNGLPVQVMITVKNNNAYDLIVKDEDIDYAGLGIAGTKYNVSIAGDAKTLPETYSDGLTKLINQRDSGTFDIKISEVYAGTGYRTNLQNDATLSIKKGTEVDGQDIYSLELISNSNEDRATVEIDEELGTITVTFKNETKHEVGIYKYDVNTKEPVENAGFRIKVQEVDADSNPIGDQKVIRHTEEGNILGEISYEIQVDENGEPVQVETEASKANTIFTTDDEGIISLDIGKTKQNKRYIYSFEEVIAPEGYESTANLVVNVPVSFDMYGHMSYGTADHWRGRRIATYADNVNGMMVCIANGDLPMSRMPYNLKVVTEDSQTNKRINGSVFDIEIDKVEDDVRTPLLDQDKGQGLITADVVQGTLLLEKGVINIEDIIDDGIIEISVDQTDAASGYEISDISPTIKLQVDYEDKGNGYEEVSIEVVDDGGLGNNLIVDSVAGQITVKIKNTATVELGINTNYRYYDFNEQLNVEEYEKPLKDVEYVVTSEIQEGSTLVTTDLNAPSRYPTDSKGNTHVKLGKSYPGKTVLYTIKATSVPEGYAPIDDIVVLIKYNSDGNIKYKEVLTSEDVAKTISSLPGETSTGSPKEFNLKVYTDKKETDINYKVVLTNYDLDDYNDRGAPDAMKLPGATYTITVEEEFGQTRTWTATTDENGKIISPEFSGYGRIKVSITQNDSAEGYNISDVTQYVELVRNKDTKTWTKTITSDNSVQFDNNDPREIDVITLSRLREGLFNLTINKIDQRDNTRIIDNPATFELIMLEEQTVYEDIVNENSGVQEDGSIIEPVSTIETTQIVETAFDPANTNNRAQASFRGITTPDEPGTYTYKLVETKAPLGYVKDAEGFLINITFEKDSKDNLVITNIENISSAVTRNKLEILNSTSNQIAAFNIKNTREEDAVGDDEYTLDITNVDGETDTPIADPALFKVWLPDSNSTEVYTETGKSYLGDGKLEYCFIEQGKDYDVRLTHMKIPTLPTEDGENTTTVEYKFKAIVPADGYALIEEELILTIEFTLDPDTGEVYITDATSSNENYLRINNKPSTDNPISTRVAEAPDLPISTRLPLSIDILNGYKEQTEFKITYDPNESEDGIVTQNMPDPLVQIKKKGETYYISDTIPTREGFEFGGWSLLKNRPADYQPGDEFNEDQDITLFAVWDPSLYVKSTKYVIGTYENYVQNKDLEENEYNEGDKYIIGIYPAIPVESEEQKNEWNIGTTLDILKQNITTNADTIKLYDKDGNELAEDKLIGTEMVIEFRKASKTIRLTAVVRGDITGDGILKGGDISKANKYYGLNDTSILDTEAKWIAFDTDLNKRLNGRDIRNLNAVYGNLDCREFGN